MDHRPPRRRTLVAALTSLAFALGLLVAAVPATASASYPGGDGRIAFVRANQIYTMTATGTGVRQLTTSGKNYRPHWSPNGRRIAFVHETASGSKDVWVMAADGSGKKQVTRLGQVTGATWSPDGTTLAFGGWSAADSHMVLQTIRSTAPFGNPTPLSGWYGDPSSPEHLWVDADGTPTWNPDGSSIAWYSHYFPSSPDNYLLVLQTATGSYDAVMAIGGSCCGFGWFADPAYSPSGELGYTQLLEPNPVTIVAPSITHPRAGDKQLSWAPAGTRIAFTNDSSGAAKVITSRLDGSGRRVLTNGYQPDWQPT